MPIARFVGFAMKEIVALFPPASELEAGLKVSHAWAEAADQLSVLEAVPVFAMATDWDWGAVLPCAAVKLRDVEVVTERNAWFCTVTMTGDEVATLLSASVVEAVRICDPFEDKAVFHGVV